MDSRFIDFHPGGKVDYGPTLGRGFLAQGGGLLSRDENRTHLEIAFARMPAQRMSKNYDRQRTKQKGERT